MTFWSINRQLSPQWHDTNCCRFSIPICRNSTKNCVTSKTPPVSRKCLCDGINNASYTDLNLLQKFLRQFVEMSRCTIIYVKLFYPQWSSMVYLIVPNHTISDHAELLVIILIFPQIARSWNRNWSTTNGTQRHRKGRNSLVVCGINIQ